jgi:polysaccharide export outer membrane protein
VRMGRWPFGRHALGPPVALLALAAGCAYLPAAGPTKHDVEKPAEKPGAAIQIVDVDDAVVRHLLALRTQRRFSETLGDTPVTSPILGPGDVVEVSIWEAPPAALFGTGLLDVRGAAASAHSTTIPEEMIDSDGFISVPFAGKIPAAGHSLSSVQAEIIRRLNGKANHPEVLVRLSYNSSRNVTVVGEVNHSLRMPLTPGYERLLDALAAAGGVRQPVNKVTIQVTRGGDVEALPLDTIIRDPKQNVPLQAGDVVTVLFESLSFTALGASGKNQEINFEAQGITLAQALARSGGLVDSQSDPRGVFIFRFEPQGALAWPRQPVMVTAEGLVPVVYRVNLRDPNSFFVMQSFVISNKDVLYVANAPVTELQKFLNLVFSVVYPLFNAKTTLGF